VDEISGVGGKSIDSKVIIYGGGALVRLAMGNGVRVQGFWETSHHSLFFPTQTIGFLHWQVRSTPSTLWPGKLFPMNTARSLLLGILFFGCATLSAQTLPKAWEGKWRGTVDIWSYGSKVDSFPMTLTITRLHASWDFVIDYQRNPARPDVREYRLVTIDSGKNQFAIDEQNSILLDTYLVDNCLMNVFAGMGSSLQTRMCLEGEVLSYEITSNFDAPERISGGEVIGKDTIPEIKSYEVYSKMKAKLRKANAE
jgi:hypothetical protein